MEQSHCDEYKRNGTFFFPPPKRVLDKKKRLVQSFTHTQTMAAPAVIRRLPEHLPRLPDAYASRSSPEFEAGLLRVLHQVHHEHRIRTTALAALVRVCNRVAHALLLSIDLNEGGTSLAFPESVGLPEILLQGAQSQTKAREGGGEDARFKLELPLTESSRWYAEYVELHEEKSLQPLGATSQIDLVAFVDYIFGEIVEIAGNYSDQSSRHTISVVDVSLALNCDCEMVHLLKYLGDPLLLSYIDALAEHFAPNQAAWRNVDAYSWYHKPEQVELLAQQYARGELLPGDEYFERLHGIRPLQFFGNHRSFYLDFRSKPHGEPAAASDDKGSLVFSFALRDKAGAWMPIVCELRASRSLACFRETGNGFCVAYINTNKGSKPSCKLGDQTHALLFNTTTPDEKEEEKDADKRTSSVSSSASSSSFLPYESNLLDQGNHIEEENKHIKDKFIVASQLAQLDRFGASLFTANHPMAVRVHFTATLVDVVSRELGLPILPMVLLRLIGEYEPANLPYIKYNHLHKQKPDRMTTLFSTLNGMKRERKHREAVELVMSKLLNVGKSLGHSEPPDRDEDEEEDHEEEDGEDEEEEMQE